MVLYPVLCEGYVLAIRGNSPFSSFLRSSIHLACPIPGFSCFCIWSSVFFFWCHSWSISAQRSFWHIVLKAHSATTAAEQRLSIQSTVSSASMMSAIEDIIRCFTVISRTSPTSWSLDAVPSSGIVAFLALEGLATPYYLYQFLNISQAQASSGKNITPVCTTLTVCIPID